MAIKLVNKSKINVKPRRLERIRREIDFMANINHPHIIKILEGKQMNINDTFIFFCFVLIRLVFGQKKLNCLFMTKKN